MTNQPKKPGRPRVRFVSEPAPVQPSTSWWLGVPADQFSRAAESEQERMQHSKLGRLPMAMGEKG